MLATLLLLSRRRRWLALLSACVSALLPSAASADNWRYAPVQLQTPRAWHSAVRIPNGSVWIAGGCSGGMLNALCDPANIQSSSEIFDGTTIATGPSIGSARFLHTATVLKSGKVLVDGGCSNATRSPVEGCAAIGAPVVCDPAPNGTCVPVPSGSQQRAMHTATLLSDGRVLIAGGFAAYMPQPALATTEIFDPQANGGLGGFTAGPSMSSPRASHTATLLSDGRVLLAGGFDKTNDANQSGARSPVDKVDVFDPMNGSILPTGSLNQKRGLHAAALAHSKVIIAGGSVPGAGLDTAELYDPQTGQWKKLDPQKLTAIVDEPQAEYLDGADRVVFVGGFSNLYDPNAETIGSLGQLKGALYHGALAPVGPMPTKNLILVGGRFGYTSLVATKLIQVFTIGTDGSPCTVDTDCNNRNCIDGVCCEPSCDRTCHDCASETGACRPIARGKEHATCAGTRVCDGAGACTLTDGRACASNVECLSGICTDGVCCAEACASSCSACDRKPAGQCIPIVGLPAPGHTACPAGQTCGGASRDCVPSICDGDHTVRAGDVAIDCTPYRCSVTGQCLERCSSIQHCTPPYACTPEGICDKPAFDRGASCATSAGGGGWMFAALGMGALAWLRGRGRRRSSWRGPPPAARQ